MGESIEIGSSIGHYRIVSKIGAGGMGEVYKAHDSRLDREVAIKVLPSEMSSDEDRLRRFEQEAKATSALNHPNILTVYDIGEHDGSPFIVAELLEGEELRERLGEGPIPLRKVTEYAQQIVSGLSAAHEKGIVHRDLKPENLFITNDDRVKILDFGLAKLAEPGAVATGSEDHTRKALTNPGVVMGTVGYMSPEQVKGVPADHRSDIFSFGLILHEMITGRRAFQHETMAETMSAILKEEPEELTASNAQVSPALERIVRRCLEKRPERRFHSAHDLGFALESLAVSTSSSGKELSIGAATAVQERQRSVWRGRMVAIAALVFGATLLSLAVLKLLKPSELPAPPTHLAIVLPDGHSFVSGPSISRDGRRVAFVSSDGVGRPQLYVRDLDEAESRLLQGTEEANNPFFSPDGNWIAYYGSDGLYKVKVGGGAPVRLAASSSNFGGTWTETGKIIFHKTWSGGLEVVNENGGQSTSFLPLDAEKDFGYVWPTAVPGGSDVLFVAWGKSYDLYHVDSRTLAKRRVAPWWRRFTYTPSGYLIGGGDYGELRAMKLPSAGEDPGKAVPVVKGADTGTLDGDARFDVSHNGTLAYVRKTRDRRSVVLADRLGQTRPVSIPEAEFDRTRVSPDGRQAAIEIDRVLSIVDLERGTITPLVPELGQAGARSYPVWSVDGRSVTFASNHEGNSDIYSKPATGAGSMVAVLKLPLEQYPQSYAPDGTLLFTNDDPKNGTELWMLPPNGVPRVWLSNGYVNGGARFSPDGHFVAYSSNTSGRFEVYVQSRDNPAERVQVSASGGGMPVWSSSGNELYFRQGNVIMKTNVIKTNGLSASVPERLFDGGWQLPQWFSFEVMPGGQEFLMVQQPREAIQTRIEIVLNWFTVLNEAMAGNP